MWDLILQHMFLFIGLIVSFVYIALCLGYFVGHRYFVLFPNRQINKTPDALHYAYEDCFFTAGDGIQLHGWFIPAHAPMEVERSETPLVVLFPGNAGSLSKFLDGMKGFLDAGADVFMFGYRGFSRSQAKRPSEKGLQHDAAGVWRYLTESRRIEPHRLILYGQSLGCSIAAWAAAHFYPGSLALEGGFTSLVDVVSRHVYWLPISLLTTERYCTLRYVEKVTCPILIGHSLDDGAIPLSHGKRLFETAQEPKRWMELRGEHAKALEIMPRFADAIIDFWFENRRE